MTNTTATRTRDNSASLWIKGPLPAASYPSARPWWPAG